jgi:hypothetical protein
MTKLFNRVFASVPEDVKSDEDLSEKMSLLQQFIRPENLDIKPEYQNETSWLVLQSTFFITVFSYFAGCIAALLGSNICSWIFRLKLNCDGTVLYSLYVKYICIKKLFDCHAIHLLHCTFLTFNSLSVPATLFKAQGSPLLVFIQT